MADTLIFNTSPEIEFAGNTFINVPVILKYESTNLVEVVKEVNLKYTTEIAIYHPDGTKVAKVKGNRVFPTVEGKNTGVKVEKHHNVWECTYLGKTVYELHHLNGDRFKMFAELFTPDGSFVKFSQYEIDKISLIKCSNGLEIGNSLFFGNTIIDCKTGVWVGKTGQIIIASDK